METEINNEENLTESEKALIKANIFSKLTWGYMALILIPYLYFLAPSNEWTSEWAFNWAEAIYIMLVIIAIILCCIVDSNVSKIQEERSTYYPIRFILCFCVAHFWLMAIHPMLFWIIFITLPIGLIILGIIEHNAKQKDKLAKENLAKEKLEEETLPIEITSTFIKSYIENVNKKNNVKKWRTKKQIKK